MDRLNQQEGFLPGIFRRSKKSKSRSDSKNGSKLEPKPHGFFKKMPSGLRNNLLAMAGEFVGTFMFLFFAFAGTQIANSPTTTNGVANVTTGPNTSVLLYIALCFGFSLAVNAWIFFRVTGGLFNPAVTLGLCLIGAVPFGRGALVFISQMLGGMAAAGVVSALLPGELAVATTLGAGTSVVQGLFIEMFLTAQLVFTIFMLAAEKHKSTFLAPIGIGLSLFIAELAGVYFTGGSLNPTRSFGPCVALRSFPTYHWIYWLGPILGTLVASGFFWFIKSCDYETVNPGQDFDDLEAEAYDPERDLTRPVVHPNATIDTTPSRTSRPSDGRDERLDDLVSGYQSQPEKHEYYDSRNAPKTYTIQAPNGNANQTYSREVANGQMNHDYPRTPTGRTSRDYSGAQNPQANHDYPPRTSTGRRSRDYSGAQTAQVSHEYPRTPTGRTSQDYTRTQDNNVDLEYGRVPVGSRSNNYYKQPTESRRR